ncbi:hypothetical protein GMD93_11490 [Pseudoflavonifractor sp. BIOML-A4]|nr:hypothetical protein [Pseudoflavonifractor sp. BIOML-A3]MTS91642.1 hypothetical protein [Pseudoflavonifractor sp. BIOML-A4]
MNETAKPFPPLRARFAHFRKKDKSRDFPLQPTGNFAIINRKSKGRVRHAASERCFGHHCPFLSIFA